MSKLPLIAALCSLSLVACDDDKRNEQTLTQAHVALLEQRIAACNAQDWDAWEALHTKDAVRTAPELPEALVGAHSMRLAIEELVTTFPDYHLELVDAINSGDKLVARIHTNATMLGPMLLPDGPVAATGRAFEQDWVAVIEFDGDKISAIDEFHDNYGILVQLGLLGDASE